MKKLKIILLVLCLVSLASCGDKKTKTPDTQTQAPVSQNQDNNTQDQDIEETTLVGEETEVESNQPENEVLNKIVEEKGGLQNATSDDIDAILQEELRMLNTPSSDYLFFEQLSTKTATIEEVKTSGGMEITNGNIYLHSIAPEHTFINKVLSEDEKLYSFNQKQFETSIVYLDGNSKDFLTKLKSNFSGYKQTIDEKDLKEATIKNGESTYIITLALPGESPRDDIDNILGVAKKVKVMISELKEQPEAAQE